MASCNHRLFLERLACWYALQYGVYLLMLYRNSCIATDRTGERFFHICVPWWGVILGYIIGVSTFSIAGRYVAMFLMACGYAGMYSFYLTSRRLRVFAHMRRIG